MGALLQGWSACQGSLQTQLVEQEFATVQRVQVTESEARASLLLDCQMSKQGTRRFGNQMHWTSKHKPLTLKIT
jgi:hypothetical protein